MFILGISAYFHDSAACLLKDGQIIAAAQEERFTRLKNEASFPACAIRFCLEFAGITLAEVDHIVFYEKPFLKFERLLETYLSDAPKGLRSFLKAMPLWLNDKLFLKKRMQGELKKIQSSGSGNREILFTEHHHSHAASAFFASPFSEAVILTVDGVGEWATTTVSIGRDKKIDMVQEIKFPHSLGLLYAAFTAYLGFKVNSDEYKVMGLAAYGTPRYCSLIYEHLLAVKADGSFYMNMDYFNYCTGLTMTNKKFDRLFGAAPRKPGEELTAFHKDIAASIQQVTTTVLLQLASHLQQQFGMDNLCMAGGVALNCVANSQLVEKSGFRKIWIQPAAGDAGGAVGAALAIYHEYLGKERAVPVGKDLMQNALLGPSFPEALVEEILVAHHLSFQKTAPEDFHARVAQYIADGKVVGYFNGRMEFGPRALGSRSILADPRNPDMQSILNRKIKFREGFRPFAPAVLEEFAEAYFGLKAESPYMLFVGRTSFDDLPAITHLDGTARVQTVNAAEHQDFYQLIHTFYRLTGCPLLINTSFNVMDEPIVCTPADAIRCFQHTHMDVLAIEGYLVLKADQEQHGAAI
ncbi:carbamoyltransferase family protein [Pedobacter sp. AW31-3R]|uniref:carbamoyltransferase family protein n=1 Tax=Pedobacter sp. AW31-3R TaxID=3445781 RepID=UPI003FA08AC4